MQNSTFCPICHQKEKLMLFWCAVCERCVLQLVLFKFVKAENTMTCNHMLYIKMTSNFLFWWEIWQNIGIFTLIRSLITNINSLQKLSMFFNLWKDWHQISRWKFEILNNTVLKMHKPFWAMRSTWWWNVHYSSDVLCLTWNSLCNFGIVIVHKHPEKCEVLFL